MNARYNSGGDSGGAGAVTRRLMSASTPKCTKPAMLQIPSFCRNYLFFLSLIIPTKALVIQYDIVNVHKKMFASGNSGFVAFCTLATASSVVELSTRLLFVYDRNNRATPAVRRTKTNFIDPTSIIRIQRRSLQRRVDTEYLFSEQTLEQEKM